MNLPGASQRSHPRRDPSQRYLYGIGRFFFRASHRARRKLHSRFVFQFTPNYVNACYCMTYVPSLWASFASLLCLRVTSLFSLWHSTCFAVFGRRKNTVISSMHVDFDNRHKVSPLPSNVPLDKKRIPRRLSTLRGINGSCQNTAWGGGGMLTLQLTSIPFWGSRNNPSSFVLRKEQ